MIVNHVMSNDVQSGIFSDIMRYFKEFSPTGSEIVVSKHAIDQADVYHYHRPHLEESLKINSICTVHHDLNETDSWLDYQRFHDVYQSSAHVVCLNSNQLKFLEEKGVEWASIIPHGYNSAIFNPDLPHASGNAESGKITLGLVSKRYGRKVKGEEYIYEVSKRLNPEVYRFLLVGDGRTQDASFLRKLGFEVEVYEYLPYAIFDSLYSEIDALLMTSFHEGGPANIPEAVVTATPIIGNDVGMVSDYLIDGVNGYKLLMDPDIDIIQFEKLQENLSILRKGAVSQQCTAISWQENIAKYFEVYEKIISEGGSR